MYRGFVLPENRRALKNILRQEPIVTRLFGDSWVSTKLCPAPDQPIESVHPFYAYLIHPKESTLTIRALAQIQKDNRRKIVAQIKHATSEDNVRGLVRNLQTYAILKGTEPSTIFEPVITGSSKRPDLQSVCGGRKTYLEIFSVSASNQELEEGRVIDQLHSRINRLGDNPFVVQVDIIRPPAWREMEWIWTCLRRAIEVNRRNQIVPDIVLSDRKGAAVLKVSLSDPNKRDKGFWGSTMKGGVRYDDARLKGKILDKLEGIQFPSKRSVNGYILYMEDFMMDVRDARNALLGQDVVTFYQGSDKVEYGRKDNGVLHHEIGREMLLGWVDFFVVVKHPTDLQKPDDIQIIMNGDKGQVNEQAVRNMFRTQEITTNVRQVPPSSRAQSLASRTPDPHASKDDPDREASIGL